MVKAVAVLPKYQTEAGSRFLSQVKVKVVLCMLHSVYKNVFSWQRGEKVCYEWFTVLSKLIFSLSHSHAVWRLCCPDNNSLIDGLVQTVLVYNLIDGLVQTVSVYNLIDGLVQTVLVYNLIDGLVQTVLV